MTLWPNGSRAIPRVSDEFGPRTPIWTPNGVTGSFHRGIDLVGFPINCSPVDGVVIFAAYNGGAGNMLRIRADNGDVFVIMHNARFLVSRGQRVSEGQGVGVMGTTGNSTGIHCHFETRPGDGDAVNPRVYMAASITAASLGSRAITADKQQEDEDMANGTRYYYKSESGTEYGIFGETYPGGFEVSTSEATGQAWGKLYGKADGAPWGKLTNAQWLKLQAEAKVLNQRWAAQQQRISSAT